MMMGCVVLPYERRPDRIFVRGSIGRNGANEDWRPKEALDGDRWPIASIPSFLTLPSEPSLAGASLPYPCSSHLSLSRSRASSCPALLPCPFNRVAIVLA